MTKPTLRFHELDLLRGVACLLVLAFHYLSRAPKAGWMLEADYPLLEPVARYGYLGVHLFFVISGFVILMSAEGASPRSFAASRVARLYPALWVGATLTAGTAWWLAEPRFAVSMRDYLINLTLFPHWFNARYVDGAYWSLAYELHFYLYVWLALRLGLARHFEWLMAAWLLVSVINAIRPMWPVEFWLNARWAPFFIAGGIFYKVRTAGVSGTRVALLAGSLIMAVFYAVFDRDSAHPPEGQVLRNLIVGGFVVAVFGIFWLIAKGRLSLNESALTRHAGALTYPVYIVHQFFGAMLYERLRPLIGHAPLALALTTAIVIAIAWLIHAHVERPLGPRLRRLLDRPRSLKPAPGTAPAGR